MAQPQAAESKATEMVSDLPKVTQEARETEPQSPETHLSPYPLGNPAFMGQIPFPETEPQPCRLLTELMPPSAAISRGWVTFPGLSARLGLCQQDPAAGISVRWRPRGSPMGNGTAHLRAA